MNNLGFNMTKNKLASIMICFGIGGFYRGTQSYDYKYKLDIKKYNENIEKYNNDIKKYDNDIITYPTINFNEPKFPNKPSKFYITNILFGCYGSMLYVSPIPGIFYIGKELYIMEIYWRNLEDAKKTKFYNDPLELYQY